MPGIDLQDHKGLMEVTNSLDLPPSSLWREIKLNIDTEEARRIELHWSLICRYLDAFANHLPTPEYPSVLTKDGESSIKNWVNYYSQLWLMLFHAEPYMKRELSKHGILYPGRIQLMRFLLIEDCWANILPLLDNFWESPSKKQFQDTFAALNLLARNGGVKIDGRVFAATEETVSLAYRKIDESYRKLAGWETFSSILPSVQNWNNFCFGIFYMNREEIPSYSSYWDSFSRIVEFSTGRYVKHAYNRGTLQEYPGRGKGKGKRKASRASP